MQDNDDISSPILGRRQILRTASAFGILGLIGSALGQSRGFDRAEQDDDSDGLIDDAALQAMCVLTPAETEGPYYLNLNLLRQNITENYPGIPTRIFIHVVKASDCTPIVNAPVDIWHCNAAGVYSGFAQQGTQGLTYLRGTQITDANGTVIFDTIYPGWYPGRTVHAHFKVHPTTGSVLTSQMYFKPQLTTRVYGRPPYSTHGQANTQNTQDGLYLAQTEVHVLSVLPTQIQLELTIGVA